MKFFFIAILFMYFGRKLGWALSKGFLYASPSGIVLPLSFLWGVLVAVSMFSLIRWQHPGLVLRIIMGYALGAYVSIPNFGLVNEATIPEDAQVRHSIVSNLPLVAYILVMIALSFLIKGI